MFCTACGAANSDAAQFCSACGARFGVAAAGVPAAGFQYTGFWKRFVAMVIDGVVFAPIGFLLLIPIGISGFLQHANTFLREGLPATLIASLIGVGIIWLIGHWLYFTLMESSRYQGTLGKMTMDAKVTDLNGNRISFARANGRFFGKWISQAMFNIGFLMAAFTEKKQALHDILAGCLVIQK